MPFSNRYNKNDISVWSIACKCEETPGKENVNCDICTMKILSPEQKRERKIVKMSFFHKHKPLVKVVFVPITDLT